MADTTPTADATSDASAMPAGVAEAVPAPPGDADLGDGGKRALAELRRSVKELKTRNDELEAAQRTRDDADRTELEKATARGDEAATKASTLERTVLKMQAAIAAGIPDQWMRLNGDSADELEKDAKAFAESLGKGNGNGNGDTGATPASLGAGPRPGAPTTGSAGFSEVLRQRAKR
jgi:hypothetical protein